MKITKRFSQIDFRVWAVGLLGVLCMAAVFSNYPTYTTPTAQDYLLIDATNVGSGTWTTEKIALTNLLRNTRVQGPFQIWESSGTFGSGGNDEHLGFWDGADIWYNFGHAVEPEWQFAAQGSASWTLGLDSQGKAVCHFGGSGAYHSLWYMQYDDNGDTNHPGHSTPFGYALHLNTNTLQNFIFGYWMAEQVDNNGTQAYSLNWHDSGGAPSVGSPGFHQTDFMATDHISFRIGSNNIVATGAEVTNTLSRGNVTTSAAITNVIDFARTQPDYITLNGGGSNLALVVSNLAYTNISFTKYIWLKAGYDSITNLGIPTNWLTLTNPAQTSNIIPTNVPASNDLVIQLLVNCGTGTTNISASYGYQYNPPVTDPDVLKFITASGIAGGSNITALNTFVTTIKGANMWNRWDVLLPLMGGTSNTCSWNLKDTNAPRTAWTVGSSTFNVNGWTSDGGTSFANTGFNPSTASSPNYTQHSATYFIYNGTAAPTFASQNCFIGAVAAGVRSGLVQNSSSLMASDGMNNGIGVGGGNNLAVTSFAGSSAITVSGGNQSLYANNQANSGVEASTAVPNANVYFGAKDNGGLSNPIQARFCFVAIGSGISSSEFTTMSNAVYNLQVALNRQ